MQTREILHEVAFIVGVVFVFEFVFPLMLFLPAYRAVLLVCARDNACTDLYV